MPGAGITARGRPRPVCWVRGPRCGPSSMVSGPAVPRVPHLQHGSSSFLSRVRGVVGAKCRAHACQEQSSLRAPLSTLHKSVWPSCPQSLRLCPSRPVSSQPIPRALRVHTDEGHIRKDLRAGLVIFRTTEWGSGSARSRRKVGRTVTGNLGSGCPRVRDRPALQGSLSLALPHSGHHQRPGFGKWAERMISRGFCPVLDSLGRGGQCVIEVRAGRES